MSYLSSVISEVIKSGGTTGSGAGTLGFSNRFDTTLVPYVADAGSATPSYSRDTEATYEDHEGLIRTATSNQARMVGSRVVENLITASEDMTNGVYAIENAAAVDSATQATFDGTTDGTVKQTVTITDDGSGDGGRTFVFSVNVRLVSGTISGDSALKLRIAGDAITNADRNIGSSVTSTTQRFSITASTDAAGTFVVPRVMWDDAGTLEITKWQLEEVTGQTNQNPSEYVSTGVGNSGGERVSDMSASQWVPQGNNTVTDIGPNEVSITYVDNGGGADIDFNSTGATTADLACVVGKDYVISGLVKINTGSANLRIVGDVVESIAISSTTYTRFTAVALCNSATAFRIDMTGMGAGEVVSFKDLSCIECDHGLGRDGVKAFTTLNGNTPAIRKFLDLDGVDGTRATSPTQSVPSTGEYNFVVYARADDWAPGLAQNMFAKWDNDPENSFLLQITGSGGLKLGGSEDGSAFIGFGSTVIIGGTNSVGKWLRASLTVDATSGGTVYFYTSDDSPDIEPSEVSWTQLGNVVSDASLTSLADTSASFSVGDILFAGASSDPFAGQIFRACLTGADLTDFIVDFNAEDHTSGSTLTSSTTGEVWTLNADAFIDNEETGVVTEATGPAVNQQWVEFDGVVGTYVSSPDTAAAPTDDMAIIAWLAPETWTPASTQAYNSKWNPTGDERSWIAQVRSDGTIRLTMSANGVTNAAASSTVATGFADGEGCWVALTMDNSEDTVNFYTSKQPLGTPLSDIDWTQLGGADVAFSSGLGGPYDGTADFEIGSSSVGNTNFLGKIGRNVVIDSTDLTADPVVDFNPNDYDAGKTWESASTSEVWTLNGNANVVSPMAKWGDLPGASGDYFSTPDSAAADIINDIAVTAYVALDDWSPSSPETFISKWLPTVSQKSYAFSVDTDGTLEGAITTNGSTNIVVNSTVSTGFANGTGHWVLFVREQSSGNAYFYTSEDSPWTPYNQISWTQLGDAIPMSTGDIHSGTALVTVSGSNLGGFAVVNGKIMRAAVIASTDPTAAPSVDFDARTFTPGVATATAPTGETWTANGNVSIEQNIPSNWDSDGPLGYLAEESRTNIALYSTPGDLGTTWTDTNATPAANYAVAPDGSKTAVRLVDDGATGTGNVILQQAVSVASGADYTFSVHLKADQLTWVNVRAGAFDSNVSEYFDLANGVAGTSGEGSPTIGIVPVGNGWYRCWIVFSSTTDLDGVVQIYAADSDGDRTVALDGTSSVLIWGAQVEAGAFPTSYIPTTTASVTRNADELTYDGSSLTFPMTMSAEFTVKGDTTPTADAYVLTPNDGATGDDHTGLYLDTTGVMQFSSESGNVNQGFLSSDTGVILGVTQSIAGANATNDLELYIDGRSDDTDTSATPPVAANIDNLDIGKSRISANYLNGTIRKVKIFGKRLSDSQVQRL